MCSSDLLVRFWGEVGVSRTEVGTRSSECNKARPFFGLDYFLHIIAASNAIPKFRIDEVLDMTGIAHKKKDFLSSLSLGEGQRLGLAVALLGDPQFLILDEPTNGLDPSGIKWFRRFIRQQADFGKTVLLSSHILSEVQMVTDDVVLIHHGQIIEQGTLEDVLQGTDSLEELSYRFFSFV